MDWSSVGGKYWPAVWGTGRGIYLINVFTVRVFVRVALNHNRSRSRDDCLDSLDGPALWLIDTSARVFSAVLDAVLADTGLGEAPLRMRW